MSVSAAGSPLAHTLLGNFTQASRLLRLATPLGAQKLLAECVRGEEGLKLAGANGGFARYYLTLEPWTAFLAHGRDSRALQDMTVFDILDSVFGAYKQQGSWRRRGITTSCSATAMPNAACAASTRKATWLFASG